MKRIVLIFLSLSIIFSLNTKIYAQGDRYDVTGFEIHHLTGFSDQNNSVRVSRYISPEGYYAFCIEPETSYRPDKYKYRKYNYDNENIYKYVKSFYMADPLDDNLFIATQLLIWEEITGNIYTFEGNDYEDYKNIILNNIDINKNKKKLLMANKPIELNINDTYTIDGDYRNYNIESNGLDIVSINEDNLVVKANTIEPLNKSIKLTELEDYTSNSYELRSTSSDGSLGSQDLYIHEGEYPNLKTKTLNFLTLVRNEFMNIYYSKKDMDNNNIPNTKFTLYELNDDGDNDLFFIKTNSTINLYDFILGDYSKYNDLSITISPRYEKYLNDYYINTNEIGYFPFKIKNNNEIIKEGIVYVTNDIDSNSIKYRSNVIYEGYSENKDVNEINSINKQGKYYLCESEPAKGYEYVHSPCKLIDSDTYNGEKLEYLNTSRKYNLKLIKNNRNDIVLDGAHFKVTYYENEDEKTIEFITGSLNIKRTNNYKYLIYKYKNDVNLIESKNDEFILKNADPGRYFYYQSNSNDIDESKFNNYIDVYDGGYEIKDLPYSSKLIIEELEAPKGYIITEPKYIIYPDISYSEIIFSNYRVNEFEILPQRRILPKTCIEE